MSSYQGKDPGVLQLEATERYLTDPVFHARVRVAASLVQWTARREGVTLSMGQHDTIVQSCAFGVLIAEHDVEVNEATHNSMSAIAHAMRYAPSAPSADR